MKIKRKVLAVSKIMVLLLCALFLSSCTVVKNDEAQIETKKPSIAADALSTEGSKVPQLSGDTVKMTYAKSEISETVKAELQNKYDEAAAMDRNVVGSILQFTPYEGEEADRHAQWNTHAIISSDDHDRYAQYIYTGKWAKWGSVQVLGGKLTDDGQSIDGQVLLLCKSFGFDHLLTNGAEFALNYPLGVNWNGNVQTYHVFAVQTVPIEKGEDFVSHKTGYIPPEAYELIESIQSLDQQAREEYYNALSLEYGGVAANIGEDDGVLILCGMSMSDSDSMIVAYAAAE